MQSPNDAFGHMLYDHMKGNDVIDVIERDDGYLTVLSGIEVYFADYKDWHATDQKAIEFVNGRILDIGCGAGRHAIYLQNRGFDVTGIDSSRLAVYVSQRRGLKKALVRSVTQVSSKLGCFDTIMLLGNNFGLMANVKRAKWLLSRFYAMTPSTGRVIAASSNPYGTDEEEHLNYFNGNQKKGRLPGQLRIRYRYKRYKDVWFDYLFVSQKEMEAIVKGTGWHIQRIVDGDDARFVAIMEKDRF